MIATQNNIMNLLVAKAIARTGTTALDPAASTYIIDGEIVVTDESNTILDSTTVVGKQRIKLVQSQGATLPTVESSLISLPGIKTYTGKAYTAPTVQIDFIGYDNIANTGDIDVISDNGYEILIHDINSAAYGSTGVSKFGFYVSDASATKAEILDGLAVSLTNNTVRLVRKPFIVERVASVIAGTDTTAATGTLTVVKGSTIVTASVASGADGLIVGSYLKTDDTAVDTGTLYKIVSLPSATTIEIDQPYQTASTTFTAGNASSHTAAQVNAGSVGIKLTGEATVFTTPQSTEYYVNRWIATVRNGGTTPVVTNTKATEGSGSYAQMASLEYFLVGNEGFIARNNVPYVPSRANIISTSNYSLIDLEWETIPTGRIFGSEPASKQLLVAFADGGNREQLTGVVTSVQTVLNAWLTGKFTALALA